jgi:hypothetical protein
LACAAAGAALPVASCSSGNGGANQPGAANDATAPVDGSLVDSSLVDGSLVDAANSGVDAGSVPGSDAGVDAPQGPDTTGCAVGDAGESLELRCTGLYSDFPSKTVSADVHQFDPGLHLWSDGAVKTRWIYLPPDPNGDGGTRLPIDTSNLNEWTFPVGTKFWKEFVLGGTRIETRLLWKLAASTWYRTTYLWSADGESSTMELTSGKLNADGNGYEVPNQQACATCHQGRVDNVLGFEAVGLSTSAATPITMQTLAADGWITKVPDAGIVIPGNVTDVAALGYLHANCGTACHNSRNGAAQKTGFFMRLEVGSMQTVQDTDTWQTGVNQPSFFQPPGTTQSLLVLAPGDAGASCVYFRMSHRTSANDAGAGIQMPPLDTHKIDDAGVSLIEQWINDVLPQDLDAGSHE